MNTETGYQLFNRIHTQTKPKLENFYPEIFPTEIGHLNNKIIQITGTANTGKSLLLTEFILHTILPTENSTKFKQYNAVLINTDHQISIIQIIKTAEKILSTLNIPQSKQQDIIKSSLKRLTVLICYSSKQLEMTMLNLEHILSDNVDIALIAIDSLSAYYWADRWEKSMEVKENAMYSVNKHCSMLLKTLKSVIGDRNIVAVFSRFETETNFSSFVDFTIKLKFMMSNDRNTDDTSDCNSSQLLILELEDHQEKRITKVVRKYTIDSFIHFIE